MQLLRLAHKYGLSQPVVIINNTERIHLIYHKRPKGVSHAKDPGKGMIILHFMIKTWSSLRGILAL